MSNNTRTLWSVFFAPFILITLIVSLSVYFILKSHLTTQYEQKHFNILQKDADKINLLLKNRYKNLVLRSIGNPRLYENLLIALNVDMAKTIKDQLKAYHYAGFIYNPNLKKEILNLELDIDTNFLKNLSSKKTVTINGYMIHKFSFLPLNWEIYILKKTEELQDDINRELQFTLLHILLILITNSILFYFLIKKFIHRDLQAIGDYFDKNTENISLEKFTTNMNSKETFKLKEGINQFIQKLSDNESKLKAQKEEFETIFNYAQDGIVITDLEGNFLKVNPAFIELTGYSQAELMKLNCNILTSPEDKQRNKDAIKQAIKTKKVENFQKSCLVADDKKIVVNMSISLLPDKQSLLLNIKNTSALKLLEEQSKLASMGEMIGNIAHQWRQPLSVISTGSTGMLMQKKYDALSDEEFEKTCNLINDSAQYLSQTIDDFRNFIRGDSTPIDFNLKQTLDRFMILIDSSIKKHEITVILEIDNQINLMGYPNELLQCFMNFFNNSKDAMVENKIKKQKRLIFIKAQNKNKKIEIIFQDSAGGIKKKVIKRIFEPYFTTKHQSHGTGLGLHMTYRLIVDEMKGSLEASNEKFIYNDKKYIGAKFTIEIPNNK